LLSTTTTTTTTTNTHSPGTYLILIRPRTFASLVNNTTALSIDDGVHAHTATASPDKAASVTVTQLAKRPSTNLNPIPAHTHAKGTLGRNRPASASATTASESSAIFPSPRVSCFLLYQGYLSVSPSDFAMSLCFSYAISTSRVPMLRGKANQPGVATHPSPQGCMSVSTPGTTHSFICSTCRPLVVSPAQSSAG